MNAVNTKPMSREYRVHILNLQNFIKEANKLNVIYDVYVDAVIMKTYIVTGSKEELDILDKVNWRC